MPATSDKDRRKSTDISDAVEQLLSQMTLEEKVGQMTMVENNSIRPDQVAEYCIGSVLSGGGGNPEPNSPQVWREMVNAFQRAALRTRLGIPLIYGVDAVHGHNNVKGAVIFPHNVGLGAARDPELVERIGRVTAKELLATSVHWTFAPSVSVPHDLRWGRSYEGYGENTQLVSELGAALVRGLQGGDSGVLTCAKHYVADGATAWREQGVDESLAQQGSTAPPQESTEPPPVELSLGQWQIDQGDACIDEAALRAIHLPPYKAAIEAGALSVMASYSTWNGIKMHAHRYLLTDVLKEELGFAGLIVTDWMAINQIDSDYYACVTKSVNAGIDMVMVPYDFRRFVSTLLRAAKSGDVPPTRIDNAVRRILWVKHAFGLFERPISDKSLLESMGSGEHRQVAREAVRKSLVLLKNEHDLLPLPKDLPSLIVAGEGADDIGLQCGGWSISWQGEAGATTTGSTILDGIRAVACPSASIEYAPAGEFVSETRAEYGLAVLHEAPYAEGFGDRADLSLSVEEVALLQRARDRCEKLIVVLLAGRSRIISEQLPMIDALVMAWLPGTEASAVADVLFGEYPFDGKLPYSWPRSMKQIPLAALRTSEEDPLFQYGYGLKT